MPRFFALATISGLLMAAQWSGSVLKASAADAEEGFRPIFNGKDLTGWQGEPGYWSVENGAITGQTTRQKPLNHPTYMYWRGGRPHNFELAPPTASRARSATRALTSAARNCPIGTSGATRPTWKWGPVAAAPSTSATDAR